MNEFGRLLENEIPRLRRYARALTRNPAKADDLVQSSLVRIEKQHLWQPDSNLRAWLFTILHNQHVNEVRHSLRQGSPGPVEDAEPVWRVEPVGDAQRLQLAVELTGDQPLPQQLRRHGGIVGEELGEDWLRRALPHRRRRRECRKEQQCNGAAPGTKPATRIPGSRYIARSQHGWEPRRAALRLC
jgi:hypothetical protein